LGRQPSKKIVHREEVLTRIFEKCWEFLKFFWFFVERSDLGLAHYCWYFVINFISSPNQKSSLNLKITYCHYLKVHIVTMLADCGSLCIVCMPAHMLLLHTHVVVAYTHLVVPCTCKHTYCMHMQTYVLHAHANIHIACIHVCIHANMHKYCIHTQSVSLVTIMNL